MKMWLELIFCKLNFVWSVCYSMCLLAWSSLVFANWTLWIYVCQVLKYLKIGVYLDSCWHLSASVSVVWIGLYFFIHRHSYDLSVNIFKSTFWVLLIWCKYVCLYIVWEEKIVFPFISWLDAASVAESETASDGRIFKSPYRITPLANEGVPIPPQLKKTIYLPIGYRIHCVQHRSLSNCPHCKNLKVLHSHLSFFSRKEGRTVDPCCATSVVPNELKSRCYNGELEAMESWILSFSFTLMCRKF